MNNDVVKHIGDGAALSVAVVTVVKWLPPIAAALSIIWTAIRIYEWAKEKWWK